MICSFSLLSFLLFSCVPELRVQRYILFIPSQIFTKLFLIFFYSSSNPLSLYLYLSIFYILFFYPTFFYFFSLIFLVYLFYPSFLSLFIYPVVILLFYFLARPSYLYRSFISYFIIFISFNVSVDP